MRLIDHIRQMETYEMATWLCMTLIPDYDETTFLGRRQLQEVIKNLEQEVN